MGVEHYENFPVASVLCPPRIRAAVVAVYNFARTADDLADEGVQPAEQRFSDLQAYAADLRHVCDGRAPTTRWAHVFEPLGRAILEHRLPSKPLADLLDAFKQDIGNPRYTDRVQLLEYCRRSANPVGRLLLHLHGVSDESSLHQSDCICTALQLINFWQDCSVDHPRGRIYLPAADASRHGVDLSDPGLLHDTAATQALVRELCDWALQTMLQGASLALRLPGRAGWELRLVVQGGLRILEKIRLADYRVMGRRPVIGPMDALPLGWRALRMRHHVGQAGSVD